MRVPLLRSIVPAFAAAAAVAGLAAQAPSEPTIDELLSLERVASPALSPDGGWVAYTVRETNWDENAYETEIWVAATASGESHQLTNAAKSSTQPAWPISVRNSSAVLAFQILTLLPLAAAICVPSALNATKLTSSSSLKISFPSMLVASHTLIPAPGLVAARRVPSGLNAALSTIS